MPGSTEPGISINDFLEVHIYGTSLEVHIYGTS